MRGRGLKLFNITSQLVQIRVAPHAGAWIETHCRGLLGLRIQVAPHAGAWIETENYNAAMTAYPVAPHAGAWIETSNR